MFISINQGEVLISPESIKIIENNPTKPTMVIQLSTSTENFVLTITKEQYQKFLYEDIPTKYSENVLDIHCSWNSLPKKMLLND